MLYSYRKLPKCVRMCVYHQPYGKLSEVRGTVKPIGNPVCKVWREMSPSAVSEREEEIHIEREGPVQQGCMCLLHTYMPYPRQTLNYDLTDAPFVLLPDIQRPSLDHLSVPIDTEDVCVCAYNLCVH